MDDLAMNSGYTQEDRAERVTSAVDDYRASHCGRFADPDEVIGDFLADLMHYCATKGVEFSEVLGRAEMHFSAEN